MTETGLDLSALAAEYADRPDALVVLDEPTIRWRGYASLIPLLLPIDSVEAHPRNPRKGNLDVIARSLSDFGQTKAIVAQASTRWITAGNHTRRAALEKLGWTHIAGVVAEMSDEDATAYLLADNRSSDLGEYDTSGLLELLGEQAEAGRIAMTGYSADDYDDLIAENDAIAETARQEFEGGYSETEDEVAERQAVRLAGTPMREVVLMLEQERYDDFVRFVGMLKREWGTSGTIETVERAVRESAERL